MKLIRLIEFLALLLLCACDSTLRVSFVTESQSASEVEGNIEIALRLNRSSQIGLDDINSPDSLSSREIKVPFSVAGTAVYGVNHQLANGTAVFPAGEREAKIKVPLLHNLAFEGDKTLIVTLGEPQGAVASGLQTHTLTILDADKSPNINFAEITKTVSEGAGTVSVTLNLEYASNKTAIIPFTVSGTATSGTDFSISNSSLTIPAGQTSGTIDIHLIDDLSIEANETIILTLNEPTGAMLGDLTTYSLTIADNDNLPTVTFSLANQSVNESAGSVTVGVNLSKTYPLDVEVPVTISGSSSNPQDHNLTATTLTIPAGSMSGSFSFTVVDDSLDEDDETVVLTMGTITNGTSGTPKVHTVTITDNDPTPSVTFTASTQSVSEAAGTVMATIILSTTSGRNVTVPYTVSGSANNPADHNLANGSFSIPAGSTSATKTIILVDDSIYEGNETIILTLGAPTNAALGAISLQTITITENDPIPTVNFSGSSQTKSEGVGSVNLTINLSAASALTTTIPFTNSGTATLGTDYTLSWTSGANSGTGTPILIPAGATSATLTLSVTDDSTYETDETAQFTLGTPTNAGLGTPTVYTVTITNNDPIPTLSFSASAQAVSEVAGTVYVLMVISNPTIYNVSIPYTVTGTATKPADHNLSSGTVTLNAGYTGYIFTFSLVDDNIAEGNETVILTFGAVTNATVGSPSVHTITIADTPSFPLENVALWLDSASELKTTSNGKIAHWNPRKMVSPLELTETTLSKSFMIPSFWLGLPAVEGFDVSPLLKLREQGHASLDSTDIFTVSRSSSIDSHVPPTLCHTKADQLWSKLEVNSEQLSELIWLEDENDPKTFLEIEEYLKQKYHINYVENEP